MEIGRTSVRTFLIGNAAVNQVLQLGGGDLDLNTLHISGSR